MKNLLFICYFFMLIACKTQQTIVYIVADINKSITTNENIKAFFPALEDKSCNESNAPSDLGIVKAWVEDKKRGVFKYVEFDLTGVSGKGLKSPFISGSFFKTVQRSRYTDCSESPSVPNFLCHKVTHTLESVGTPINICKKEYGKDSAENAFLISAAGVHLTAKFYQSLGSASIAPIYLYILPDSKEIVEYNGKEYSLTEVNNAMWTNRYDQSSISMLPISTTYQEHKEYADPILYNQITTSAHEMGHAIAFQLASNFFLTAFQASPNVVQAGREVNSDNPDVFNEGFADALAEIALASIMDHKSLGGLHHSKPFLRNIFFDTNIDSAGPLLKPKVLDDDVLTQWLKPWSSRASTADANWQDCHTIGTFWATQLTKLFLLQTSSQFKTDANYFENSGLLKNNLAREIGNRYISLLQKLQINNNEAFIDDPYEFLLRVSWDGVELSKIGTNQYGKPLFLETQCAQIKKGFPPFNIKWKSWGYSCKI